MRPAAGRTARPVPAPVICSRAASTARGGARACHMLLAVPLSYLPPICPLPTPYLHPIYSLSTPHLPPIYTLHIPYPPPVYAPSRIRRPRSLSEMASYDMASNIQQFLPRGTGRGCPSATRRAAGAGGGNDSVSPSRRITAGGRASSATGQGLTLVQFSARPQPFWSHLCVPLCHRLGENHAPNVSHKTCLR